VLYEVRDYPIFQNRMYDTAAEASACPTGDIQLVQDPETGVVHNQAFVAELMDYDQRYQNEQAVSAVFRDHLEAVAAIVDRTLGSGSLVEVGCGKGYFLEMLLARGIDITGFDPAYEGNTPRILRQYYTPESEFTAEGIILRHVLEHVERPFEFLHGILESNARDGKIYIEVPCLDWIAQHDAVVDIFYEHVNYFRIVDFQRIFDRIEESGHLFGGQYLYVVADLASLTKPDVPADAQIDLSLNASRILRVDEPGEGRRAAIWGGASKGAIFALLRQRAGRPVDMVIDVNPAKQGKYMPGTGLEVLSPAAALPLLPAGATIFVMNSNYLPEIEHVAGNAYRYVGADND
jgi:hypothetical protein